MTPAERRLWSVIRGGNLGIRFRRQVPIGDWIIDFACLNPKLAIEIDDRSHELRDEEFRSHYIRSRGFLLLRYTNTEIALELPGVVAGIRAAITRMTV